MPLPGENNVGKGTVELCREFKVDPDPKGGLTTVKSQRTLGAWASGQEA